MRKYDELVVTEQPEKMEARWTYVPGAPHALFVVENDKLQCLDDEEDERWVYVKNLSQEVKGYLSGVLLASA